VPDDDLAEPLAGQLLFLEGALDLLDVEQAAVDEQRAEVLPGEVGRFHAACIVIWGRDMKAVLQRVSRASVSVEGEVVGEIGPGLCVLLGVGRSDGTDAASRLAGRVARLRVFEDENGRFDRSLLDVGGEALVVSQFTLLGDTTRPKGTRPDFSQAAPREQAEPLYEAFCTALRDLGVPVQAGRFAARMAVELVNDGPVTLVLEV
jgi:D-tyrosyl-tRNA(Tyr) deacylase